MFTFYEYRQDRHRAARRLSMLKRHFQVPRVCQRPPVYAVLGRVKKQPESVADAIIWHPDVRKMLLTQRAIAEGGRAMIFHAAKIADKMFKMGP